jgi:hypothetical protein
MPREVRESGVVPVGEGRRRSDNRERRDRHERREREGDAIRVGAVQAQGQGAGRWPGGLGGHGAASKPPEGGFDSKNARFQS